MTTTLVSSVDELYTALSTSQSGDVIELAPGTYDKISLWKGSGFDINFDGPVTIRSADTENPAVVRELGLNGASNLVFDGIHFDYEAAPGQSVKDRPFDVQHSENITIKNSVFDGDLAEGVDARADGFGTGVGLSIRYTSNIVVENNEFFDFYKGVGIGEVSDIVFRDNDIHSIRGDGLTMVKTVGALIEGNHIHDFERNLEAGDHSDMIQMWTFNTDYPSTDITIRNNHLDIGNGDHTQSIFMRNEAAGLLPEGQQEAMFYQNITIEDNLIVNAHVNSLVVGHTDGLTISGNILLHADGENPRDLGHRELPMIRLSEESTNVVVTDNVGYYLPDSATNPDWVITGNTVAQDLYPEEEGYYTSAEAYLAEHAPEVVAPEGEGNVPASEAGNTPAPTTPEPTIPWLQDFDFDEAYSADFGSLAASGAVFNTAEYDEKSDAFVFSCDRGAVALGKLKDYRDTDQVMVDMKFMVNEMEGSGQLFNNHMRLSASVEDDGLNLRVATQDEGFKKYEINGLDLANTGEHHLTLVLDREEDHLQVILNGEVVLEDMETNFVSREGLHNWGWTLGNLWHDSMDGSINEFNLSDEAQFAPTTSAIEIG